MSEAKRVPLQTLEFPESLGHAAKKEKKGEKGKQLAPSFRFTLALPESNEKTCPEFNYAQLLKAAEKKRRKETKRGEENSANGLDPFDDDDDDKLRDMAKRFEAKYGTSTVDRKKRKYDDYVDLGAGYDENDSFIDNTDAYDEIVPEEVTTAHGGFYINCGALEFKAADRHSLLNSNNNNNNNNTDDDESSESSDEDTEDVDSPKRAEKRIISSSEDEDPEDITGDHARKKPKIDETDEKKSAQENAIKKKKKQQDQEQNSHQDSDGSTKKKEKREASDADGGTISEDQEERKKSEKAESQKSKSESEKKFDIKKFEKKTPNTNGFDGKKVDIKKLGGKDRNIDDAIESVVNAARVEDESSRDTTDSGKSRCLGSESECEDIDKEEPAPIPETLSEDDKQIVNQLKAHAKEENSKDGKSKFFNSNVNSLLCSLEKSLRTRNTPSDRLQTYGHLSRFLPSSKTALQNRGKKLHLQEVEYKAKEPMQRLKTIIDNVMPSVMEKYLKDCQKVANEKGFEGSPAHVDSSDDEDGNQNSEKSKIPRKRFPWTKETKKLIFDIANARREYFEVLRPRKQTMQSCVLRFLETKVLPLWPQGYVDLQTLIKYSSNKPVVKKKPKKMKEVGSEGNAATGNTCNDSVKVDIMHTNSMSCQEKEKPQPVVSKVQSVDNASNFVNQGSVKSNDVTIEKKQQPQPQSQPQPQQQPQTQPQPQQQSQPQPQQQQQQQQPQSQPQPQQQQQQQQQNTKQVKEKGQQNENSSTSNTITSVGKISVVPTAQLMAQKPAKNHLEKFGLMDLANSSLSITPVNDFHKSSSKISEPKKDVVSITAYPETATILPNANEVPQTGHHSMHRQEASYSCNTQSQHSSYSASSQSSPHSKTSSLKHRILHDSAEIKTDKRPDEKDLDSANKAEKREKRRDRADAKQKLHDAKKRKKDSKVNEPQVGSMNAEIVPIPQPQPALSKEEQEQRQNEETIAATNFLSQIINDDVSARALTEKRKDSGVIIEESLASIVQPTEQEKDVQMVMRSLKELQELQEMKYSPSHSPIGSSIQKSSKSSTQYVTYQEDYQRLYHKKDDKLRPKEEPQW